jgi:hypothetical protein
VQRTGEGTPPRWHVDVETDDIAAEVGPARGPRRPPAGRHGPFLADERPGRAGVLRRRLFCVVGIQTRDEFDRHATTWP